MKSRLMMIAWLVFTPWPLFATEALRVDFVEPERYTDLGLSGSTTERIQTHILGELERYLKDLAAHSLPPFHTLHLTVFDLDMAGEYEPWRVPNLTNTRFIRDVYRPRIDLGYIWRDEHGLVLAERREQVSDLDYLMLADPHYTTTTRCVTRRRCSGAGLRSDSPAGPTARSRPIRADTNSC